MRSILRVAIVSVLVSACTTDITGDPGGTGGMAGAGGATGGAGGETGGDNGSGTGTTSTTKIAAAVDQSTVTTELGKTVVLTYTISSVNGYAGTVTVTPSVTNATQTAITGWTLTPTPASVSLTAGSSAQVKLNVVVPTNTAELTPIVKLELADGASTAAVSSNFTVQNQLTITLDAVGATNGTHATWPAKNAPIKILSGATIIFHNADTATHRIHAGGGISHEPNELIGGADYNAGKVTQSATWYCHDHENGQNDTRLVSVQ